MRKEADFILDSPASYVDMVLWFVATIILVSLFVICAKQIKGKRSKAAVLVILFILIFLFVSITYAAYIEASGQMVQ